MNSTLMTKCSYIIPVTHVYLLKRKTLFLTTGVVATKAFGKGSILCDFHGKVITGAEGREIAEMQDELGHLFFFKHGSEEVCIDAETFPCECHPSLETKGRWITHSKKNFNVQPRHCIVKLQEGDRDVLLF